MMATKIAVRSALLYTETLRNYSCVHFQALSSVPSEAQQLLPLLFCSSRGSKSEMQSTRVVYPEYCVASEICNISMIFNAEGYR